MATKGVERRARLSREVWTKRVGAWRRSGMSAERFCRGREFVAPTLRWWAWRLGSCREAAESAGLVRVEVDPPRPPTESSALAVVLPGGIEIRVAPNFEAEALERLILCVEGRRRC